MNIGFLKLGTVQEVEVETVDIPDQEIFLQEVDISDGAESIDTPSQETISVPQEQASTSADPDTAETGDNVDTPAESESTVPETSEDPQAPDQSEQINYTELLEKLTKQNTTINHNIESLIQVQKDNQILLHNQNNLEILILVGVGFCFGGIVSVILSRYLR